MLASTKQLKRRVPPEDRELPPYAKRQSRASRGRSAPVARDPDEDAFEGASVFEEEAGTTKGAQGEALESGEARERTLRGGGNGDKARERDLEGGGGGGESEEAKGGQVREGDPREETTVGNPTGKGDAERAVVVGAIAKDGARLTTERENFRAALGKLYNEHTDGGWNRIQKGTQVALADAALVLGGRRGILELRDFIRWQRIDPLAMAKFHGLVRASPEPETNEASGWDQQCTTAYTTSKGAVAPTPRKALGIVQPKRSPLGTRDPNAGMGAGRAGKVAPLPGLADLSDPVQVAANQAQARCVYSWEAVTKAERMESTAKASRVWHLLRFHEHYEDAVEKMQLTYHGAEASVMAKQALANAMLKGDSLRGLEGAQKARPSRGRRNQGGREGQPTAQGTLEPILKEAKRFMVLARTLGEGVVVLNLGLSGVLKRYLRRVPDRLLANWLALVLQRYPWVKDDAFRAKLDTYLQKVIKGSPATDDGRLLVIERVGVATAIDEHWGNLATNPGRLMEVEGVAMYEDREEDRVVDKDWDTLEMFGGDFALGDDQPSSFAAESVENLGWEGESFNWLSSDGADCYTAVPTDIVLT